jgi:hypothetical protein
VSRLADELAVVGEEVVGLAVVGEEEDAGRLLGLAVVGEEVVGLVVVGEEEDGGCLLRGSQQSQ